MRIRERHAALNALQYLSNRAATRRSFLRQSGTGLGAIALAQLLADDALRAAAPAPRNPLAPRAPHFTPRARRVIWLFMHGGPSHVDLFDPKPELSKWSGQPLPESYGEVMTRRKVAANPLLGPVKPFRPRGESGPEVSDSPAHRRRADDFRARSVHGDSVNHPQSVYQMNTGSILTGRPSVGAWVSYGLGTENQDMPAFVVLPDPAGGIKGGPPAWGNGYLPATYQGTTVRPGASPILHLRPASNAPEERQRRLLDFIQSHNREHLAARDHDDSLAARINAYELAFRMQSTAPEVVDLSQETQATLDLYGIGRQHTNDYGTRCLLARRMIERGVRFVQVYSGDTNGWDAHNDVLKNHSEYSRKTDQPVAAPPHRPQTARPARRHARHLGASSAACP